MEHWSADVVVVGGGATGVGVARDAAMRGLSVILLERADLGQGTSGRFHGLLHSGGRYVVSDPESARECAEENIVVGKIHASAVERTGGLFVVGPDDDPAYSDGFLKAAAETGVRAEEISVGAALAMEPRLNPRIKRAFAVDDASVDGWTMIWGAARSARAYGARIETYHEVVDVITREDHGRQRVVGVKARGLKSGQDVLIDCAFLVNASGAWAGQIARMAGVRSVEIVSGRGIMIAMNHRLVNHVINRCIYPADGDILVPDHTVCIIGTTDERADDPDHLDIPAHEVQQMMDAGEVLVPGFRKARAVHAWAGARPLIRDMSVEGSDTRHMSRGMSVINHGAMDDVAGIVTVAGGKLTTYRLMAKKTVDAVCEDIGIYRACSTDREAVPGSEDNKNYLITHRLKKNEDERLGTQTLCECELVTRRDLTHLMAQQPNASFDDLRRQLRIGMGPCQGGFCSARVAGVHSCEGRMDAGSASELLRTFLAHRWIGLWPIMMGEQVRETALDFWMLQGTLDIEDLPQAPSPLHAATPVSYSRADNNKGQAGADIQSHGVEKTGDGHAK
ncbi:anaerobic glycerol-3-phosphate dehydrogenase subunit GlpA [Actinomyces vulturis]|uniref:anaerobic glycerol-3-phosphate dehydrogenase subunit GlpA n=1 Tax=Actinomyces vulturis TaxID=1857645 RepID=UPI00083218E6|nr:anaerobic glycerol-3-phosphate dehydrogenase subunit GlpA [Actinomyces vulturis]